MAALIGGSLPTLRGRPATKEGEKSTSAFYFQVIHPDALSGNNFAEGRTQLENLGAVIADILGHGNDGAMLPGQLEAMRVGSPMPTAACCSLRRNLRNSIKSIGNLAERNGIPRQ